MNDISNAIGSSVLMLFADDIKVHAIIYLPTGHYNRQRYRNNVSHWCNDNGMQLNALKFQSATGVILHDYPLNGSVFKRVDQ